MASCIASYLRDCAVVIFVIMLSYPVVAHAGALSAIKITTTTTSFMVRDPH